jgi:hypothetical protein
MRPSVKMSLALSMRAILIDLIKLKRRVKQSPAEEEKLELSVIENSLSHLC